MFLTKIRADAGSDRSPYGSFWFEPLGSRSAAGARVTAHSSLGLPIVWACVNVLAKSFAVMPFVMYGPGENGRRGAKMANHWLTQLFCVAPNRFQSPFEWRLMLMGHLALRGNAFCQITSNSKGEITELLPLRPDGMTVEMLDNGSYRYRYVDQFGEITYYARNEIWHLRGMSSDGIMGLSPIEVAREAIGEGLAMQSYSARFFANDARPGGWVEYPGNFTDKTARQTFKESWQESYAGANLRKVAVLERGMKYHELTLNNSDAQFIEGRASKVSEIARIWGVPPHKVGDLSKSAFSNIEQQSIEFWTDCMLPWAELWESSVKCFLLGDAGLDVEFDMSRMLRGDLTARTAFYQGGINAGWLTRNEAREAEGYDPLGGLDEPLRPLNMVEESAAPDKLAEQDKTDDAVSPSDTGPDPSSARLQTVLRSNAARMARRIAGGSIPSAEVLAAALAITEEKAAAWLSLPASGDEQTITASLIALGDIE